MKRLGVFVVLMVCVGLMSCKQQSKPNLPELMLEDGGRVYVTLQAPDEGAEALGEQVAAVYYETENKGMRLAQLPFGADHPYWDSIALEEFQNVLGHSGVKIGYSSGSAWYNHDYYALFPQSESDEMAALIATAYNSAYEVDLDGDGQKELLSNYHTMGYLDVFRQEEENIICLPCNAGAGKLLGLPEDNWVVLRYREDGSVSAYWMDSSGKEIEQQVTLSDLLRTAEESLFGRENVELLPEKYDFDHDGTMETVELEESGEGFWTLRVMEDGWCRWEGSAAKAHIGWNNIFAGRINGQDYLMQYRPYMNQGYASYQFEVFSLRDTGGVEPLAEYEVNFDVNFESPMHGEFNVPEITAFLQVVHANLENSTILLATQDGEFQRGGSGSDFWLDDPTGGLLRESDNWFATLKAFSGDESLTLFFSSGAGGWGTELVLQPDGSFTGFYKDSDMGTIGDGYPNGTMYLCGFEGKFSERRPRDEYSFSMTLESLTSDYEEGKEWIEDGVRYISSEPYGMEAGKEFVLYVPETPSAGLDEEFRSWWPFRGMDCPETLELYGLWNVERGYGFFG